MRKRNERITVLAIGGTLALNYPWLSLFSTDSLLFGVPWLYLYLFLVWGVFIALVGLLIDTGQRETNGTSPSMLKNPPDKK